MTSHVPVVSCRLHKHKDRRDSKRSQTNLWMWIRDGWTPGSSSATPRIWLSPAEKRARRDGRRDGTCSQLRSQVRSEVKRTWSEESRARSVRRDCSGWSEFALVLPPGWCRLCAGWPGQNSHCCSCRSKWSGFTGFLLPGQCAKSIIYRSFMVRKMKLTWGGLIWDAMVAYNKRKKEKKKHLNNYMSNWSTVKSLQIKMWSRKSYWKLYFVLIDSSMQYDETEGHLSAQRLLEGHHGRHFIMFYLPEWQTAHSQRFSINTTCISGHYCMFTTGMFTWQSVISTLNA